jgi:hypothetical protein
MALGAEVPVLEVAAPLEQGGGGLLVGRRLSGEPIELVEVLRRAVRPEVFDQAWADVRVVGHDDDRFRPCRPHGMMSGMRSQPRTVDVGASLMLS